MKIILTALGLVLVVYMTYAVLPDRYNGSVMTTNRYFDKTEHPKEYWFSADPATMILINNMETKAGSWEQATNSGCKAGINAFFYDTNNRPLGWLVIAGVNQGKFYKSGLLNGVLYTANSQFFIDRSVPVQAEYGHQSGPVLIWEQKAVGGLDTINSDRRSVAIQTTVNTPLFAYFEEVTLAELPNLILRMADEENFQIKNAINLDGGSSSSFWTADVQVMETFLSGGWWCVKRV